MLKSDFSKAKVGDSVLSLAKGWSKITKILSDKNDPYPIKIAKVGCFTKTGKFVGTDELPTLFLEDEVSESFLEVYGQPPRNFSKGEVIAVKNYHDDSWSYASFVEIIEGLYKVSSFGGEQIFICKIARPLNPIERGW